MFSFVVYSFIIAIFFSKDSINSVSNDTWLIILAISLSTDIRVFRWIFKNS